MRGGPVEVTPALLGDNGQFVNKGTPKWTSTTVLVSDIQVHVSIQEHPSSLCRPFPAAKKRIRLWVLRYHVQRRTRLACKTAEYFHGV